MKGVIEALLFHMERAQSAYKLYLADKKYFQALRIYKANSCIYDLLCSNAGIWYPIKDSILEYLFHLEDWMEQFKQLEVQKPVLTDRFVFERLEGSPSFPAHIFKDLKNLLNEKP